MGIKDRAETYAEKRAVMEQLLQLWRSIPTMRLTQLLECACPGDKFYVEDKELVRRVRSFIQKEDEAD